MRKATLRRWLALLVAAAGMAWGAARADNVNVMVGVTNPFPNPFTVSITIGTPTALSGLVSFSATLSALLVDNNDNGVSLAPIGGFILEGLINGVPVGADSLGTVTASFLPTGVFSGTFNCGGACNTFGLLFNFLLSPLDAATLTASFTVNAFQQVAEPAPWLLLVQALALCALARRRAVARAARR